MENILDIGSKPEYSEGIASMELHTYQPYSSKSFGIGDEIRIAIQHQDICTYPGRNHIEGKLLKSDGGYPSKDLVLTNNAFAFLFDEISYEINGMEITRVRNLGTTLTLKGYASYSSEKVKSLLNSGWLLPKEKSELVAENGVFNACIPLGCLLGFAEGYDRILYGVKQELVLSGVERMLTQYYDSQTPSKRLKLSSPVCLG
jgi:hypothetical protein